MPTYIAHFSFGLLSFCPPQHTETKKMLLSKTIVLTCLLLQYCLDILHFETCGHCIFDHCAHCTSSDTSRFRMTRQSNNRTAHTLRSAWFLSTESQAPLTLMKLLSASSNRPFCRQSISSGAALTKKKRAYLREQPIQQKLTTIRESDRKGKIHPRFFMTCVVVHRKTAKNMPSVDARLLYR